MCSTDIFLGLLALVFPPLAVWVKRGICSADSVINILLCVLGYIPGLIHAWYIIAKFPEPDFDYEALGQDAEGGRLTYVVVQPALVNGMGNNVPGGNNNSRRNQGPRSSSHHITTTSVAGDSNVPSPVVAPAAAPKINNNNNEPMNYGTTAAAASSSGPSAPTSPRAQPSAAATAAAASSSSTHAYAAADDFDAGEGRSDGPPPSYAQTVAGDHKIQTQD